jgi:anti-sigma regulatory factor (Ser/Thr protein kinase)
MTAVDRPGFMHAAAMYSSDEDFLSMVVPFLHEGLIAGEPTLLGVTARQQGLIHDALGDAATGLTLLNSADRYDQPFAALHRNHQMFASYRDKGAPRVRVVGQVPHPSTGAPWDGWVRYEAAINQLYAPFDVWGLCPYDTRSTPDPVLADVERTHGLLAGPDGRHRPNPRYTDPADFLAARAQAEVDPLEDSEPAVTVAEPTPSDARRAVAALARTTTLDSEAVDNLVLAVSEVVTNATVHGQPPVDLRAWAADDRVVVAIRDRGPGPADPFAGYLPRTGHSGGLGLWTTHQLCSRVTLSPTPDGFTVRLVAGTPHPVRSADISS